MFEEMSLSSLAFDMYSGEPLVLLKDNSKNNSFLVTGSNQDIRYLMAEFSGRTPDAASPYSLISTLLFSLSCEIKRLELILTPNNIPTGQIHILNRRKKIIQPCRPIDVVLMSNKLTLPIWVSTELLNREKVVSYQNTINREKMPIDEDFISSSLAGDKKILM